MVQKQEVSFFDSIYFKITLFVLGCVFVWLFLNFNGIQNFISHQVKKETTSKSITCSETDSIDKAKKAVVKIKTDNVSGTGFLFNSPYEGNFVLTNYHVVKDIDFPKIVYFDKSLAIGKLFNWDEETDLAVIKVDRGDINALEFGEPDYLQNGHTIVSIGFPFGSILPGEATVNKGTLAAKRDSDYLGIEYLQIDASVNPGNSGGPVIDLCGKVMGIMTAGINEAQGLNFAISTKTAKTMVHSLISTGPKTIDKEKFKVADASILVATVFNYYDYISTRQLDLAYELLSSKMQREVGGREYFSKGFNTTLNVYLQEVTPMEFNTVGVKLFSADLVGEKVLFKSFSGTWELSEIDGIWKLNEANISEYKP